MNVKLEDATKEEIKAELLRRKAGELPQNKPAPKNNINTNALASVCSGILDEFNAKGYADGNYYKAVYDVAMLAVFGDEFTEWLEKVVNYHTQVNLANSE